jgi:hypothetical protein
MSFTDAIIRILAEITTIGNGILWNWVNIPANVGSPLDPNATLTASGHELVGYVASAALVASNIICEVLDALF